MKDSSIKNLDALDKDYLFHPITNLKPTHQKMY